MLTFFCSRKNLKRTSQRRRSWSS